MSVPLLLHMRLSSLQLRVNLFCWRLLPAQGLSGHERSTRSRRGARARSSSHERLPGRHRVLEGTWPSKGYGEEGNARPGGP